MVNSLLKIPPNQQQQISSLYLDENKTVKEIAVITEIPPHTITRLLSRLGIRKTLSEAKRKYNLDVNIFETIDKNWKAYFLGWLFSDGNVYRGAKRNTVSLCLQEGDKDVLDYFNNLLFQGTRPLNYREARYKKGTSYLAKPLYRLSIDSRKICDDLEKLGCIPNKSLIVRFPSLNEDFIPFFVQGYFEGNGGIQLHPKKGNRVTFNCGSPFFLEDLQAILLKIGIPSTISKKEGNCFLLSFYRKEYIRTFGKFIYENSTFKLERKYEKLKIFNP